MARYPPATNDSATASTNAINNTYNATECGFDSAPALPATATDPSPVFSHSARVSLGISSKSDSRRSAFAATSSCRPLLRRTL